MLASYTDTVWDNLLSTKIETDTLFVYMSSSPSLKEKSYLSLKIWKKDENFHIWLPKISIPWDEQDTDTIITRSSITQIYKMEMQLRKLHELNQNCSNGLHYFMIIGGDTLKLHEGTCEWDGLSELLYELNGHDYKVATGRGNY